MTKKKMLVIGLLLLGLFIVFKCDKVNINRLDKRTITFDRLPTPIQIYFHKKNKDIESMICLDKKNNYEFSTKFIGPWVNYSVIEDKEKKIKYKVPLGNAIPLFIYNEHMYEANEYNIYDLESAINTKFTVYKLLDRKWWQFWK